MTGPRASTIRFGGALPESGKGQNPTSEFLPLFLKDQRRIYGYLVTLLVDPHLAEDLLQETAVVLLQKFDEFRPGSNFFSWACQIAYYLVLNYRRRKKHEILFFDEVVLEELAHVAVEEEALLEVRRAALYHCMSKLSPKDRQLFESRYALSTKGKDLADSLGRPAESIYRSLGRIRRALVECLRRSFPSNELEGGW